ncbi:MAG: hypothetical protein EHM58_02510 [Ignavibacteriae bacterium]|nr:MAG: hypothetical protein EHM58_02510 [Ignavibacteriota bacterium]
MATFYVKLLPISVIIHTFRLFHYPVATCPLICLWQIKKISDILATIFEKPDVEDISNPLTYKIKEKE